MSHKTQEEIDFELAFGLQSEEAQTAAADISAFTETHQRFRSASSADGHDQPFETNPDAPAHSSLHRPGRVYSDEPTHDDHFDAEEFAENNPEWFQAQQRALLLAMENYGVPRVSDGPGNIPFHNNEQDLQEYLTQPVVPVQGSWDQRMVTQFGRPGEHYGNPGLLATEESVRSDTTIGHGVQDASAGPGQRNSQVEMQPREEYEILAEQAFMDPHPQTNQIPREPPQSHQSMQAQLAPEAFQASNFQAPMTPVPHAQYGEPRTQHSSTQMQQEQTQGGSEVSGEDCTACMEQIAGGGIRASCGHAYCTDCAARAGSCCGVAI